MVNAAPTMRTSLRLRRRSEAVEKMRKPTMPPIISSPPIRPASLTSSPLGRTITSTQVEMPLKMALMTNTTKASR